VAIVGDAGVNKGFNDRFVCVFEGDVLSANRDANVECADGGFARRSVPSPPSFGVPTSSFKPWQTNCPHPVRGTEADLVDRLHIDGREDGAGRHVAEESNLGADLFAQFGLSAAQTGYELDTDSRSARTECCVGWFWAHRLCRTQAELSEEIRAKIGLFCNMPASAVFSARRCEVGLRGPASVPRTGCGPVGLPGFETRRGVLRSWRTGNGSSSESAIAHQHSHRDLRKVRLPQRRIQIDH